MLQGLICGCCDLLKWLAWVNIYAGLMSRLNNLVVRLYGCLRWQRGSAGNTRSVLW